jgi:hypothetical protein
MGIFGNTIKSINAKQKASWRDLINRESAIGGQLFGYVPAKHRREFFCLDRNTWVWYEEWIDEHNKPHHMTTRYEITPHGVIKAQDGQAYSYLQGQEAVNFSNAVKQYHHRVMREIYNREPQASY